VWWSKRQCEHAKDEFGQSPAAAGSGPILNQAVEATNKNSFYWLGFLGFALQVS
jgi:hypothetical protein